tara:strand:- start:14 stop:817 length:804 start_codon:yes stop_codon:yes gene_type:complete
MEHQQFIDFLQQHHPHIGEKEACMRINRVSDDFCMRTEILKHYIDVGDTTAGQRYYPSASAATDQLGNQIEEADAMQGEGFGGAVLKILNVWVDDVLIPRLVTKNAAQLIDDDEYTGADNALATPSSTSNERYWYPIESKGMRLGIVEKSTNTVTRDDKTSQFQSVSETGLQIRVHAIVRSAHLSPDLISGGSVVDGGNKVGTLEIPSMYHNAIVDKAISQGYTDPRNLNLQMAQYFDNEYEKAVKKAKTWARSNGVTTGSIAPCDF